MVLQVLHGLTLRLLGCGHNGGRHRENDCGSGENSEDPGHLGTPAVVDTTPMRTLNDLCLTGAEAARHLTFTVGALAKGPARTSCWLAGQRSPHKGREGELRATRASVAAEGDDATSVPWATPRLASLRPCGPKLRYLPRKGGGSRLPRVRRCRMDYRRQPGGDGGT